jgi:hypothetical protein
MASREYSTWKRRPSGEKVLMYVSSGLEMPGKVSHLMPRSIQDYLLAPVVRFAAHLECHLPYSDREMNILKMMCYTEL